LNFDSYDDNIEVNVTSPALFTMFLDKTPQTPSEKLLSYVDSSATGHINVATDFTVDHD